MGATTQPTTFQDLYYAVVQQAKVQLGTTEADTTTLNYARRLINQGLHDLHIQQNWPWAERRSTILTHARYTTGNLNIASTTRTTLEGNGTLWNTAVSGMGTGTTFTNLRVGGKLQISGETDVYLVGAVASDTSATLDTRYVGNQSTATAFAAAYKNYTYFEDEYALASDFWRLVDARQLSDAIPIAVIPRQEFYRRYPRNATTGMPQVCTLLELGPGQLVDPRPRILFHPAPDIVYSIPYRYITTNLAVSATGTQAANLSAATDEPIIPLRYRHVLIQYALWLWYRDLKDDQRAQQAEQAYVDIVKRMAGDTEVNRDRPRFAPRTNQYRATVAGPRSLGRGGSRRFSTGTAFDELRD